jgi:phenylacetate-CoA ligase
VELAPETPDDDDARARKEAEVRHHIKSMIGVTCEIAVKRQGEVPRSQGKAVRVKDERKTSS